MRKLVEVEYDEGASDSKFDIEWVDNEIVKINSELKNINNDGEWTTYFINQ